MMKKFPYVPWGNLAILGLPYIGDGEPGEFEKNCITTQL